MYNEYRIEDADPPVVGPSVVLSTVGAVVAHSLGVVAENIVDVVGGVVSLDGFLSSTVGISVEWVVGNVGLVGGIPDPEYSVSITGKSGILQ